jgi:uncharacterized protein DUF4235
MAHVAEKVTMKLMTVVVGIPVAKATKKLVEGAWHAARPADAPRRPNERGVRWADAVGWAALSAAGVVLADLLTRKGAEEVWRTIIGTEPPPHPKTKAEKKLEKAQEKADLSA